MRYLLDFETKSSLSLPTVGTKRYLNTPDADIICMSWISWDDEVVSDTRLWLPGMPPPFNVDPTNKVYAYNIQFDYAVWHTLGLRYLLSPFTLSQCVDVMAICGRYTYPQKLDFVGRVLQLKVQKDRRGKALMNKICSPPFEYTQDDLHQFYEYCVTDTTSMFELLQALPKDELEPSEQRIWEVTAKINARGVPVDGRAIKRIHEVTEWYKKREMIKVSDVTDSAVKTVNQTAAIISWCRTQHVVLPNLQKETVAEFLLREELPDKVRQLLTLRQRLGKTSTAKYTKLKGQDYYGRVYDNLRYYGAATGRWSGLGFQIHNLPRAKVDDPEETISQFYDASIVLEDPIQAAKALIRPMIKAPKDKMICAVDYSAIENVLLLWVARQEDKLQAIRDGKDHYKVFAAEVYGVPYDEVTATQRFLGKTGVLGAGYNAAAGAYLNFALGYGLSLSFNEADAVIRLYRQGHPMVKTLWYKLRDCALAAVNHRGVNYQYHDCHFRVVVDRNFCSWLRIKLPSGRSLVYNSPEVRDDKYGPVVTHMGINSYTKQWARLKLIPGRITENIVQALARDILAHAKIKLFDAGMDVIASIHDEVVLEVGERSPTLEEVISIVTDLPAWAKDIPLRATGFIEKRYRKD